MIFDIKDFYISINEKVLTESLTFVINTCLTQPRPHGHMSLLKSRFLQERHMAVGTRLIPYSHRLLGAKIKGSELGTEIRGGAKIKGSQLGTENRGERKLKGVNRSPKFEKLC